MRIRSLSLFVALTVVTGVAHADEITFWNTEALRAIKVTGMNPPMASRALALCHTAMYDSVNGIDQTHAPYRYTAPGPPGALREAAAAGAAFRTLTALFPSQTAYLQGRLKTRFALMPNVLGKYTGLSYGDAVGKDALFSRSNDGSTFNPGPYTGSSVAGLWRPTPPAFLNGLLPAWGRVTPFALRSGDQFRMGPPPALASLQYENEFAEVKSLGKSNSATRTADQTNIALFWADGGGTVTPPGHWNRIAQSVSAAQGNTLSQNARLFALLNMAMADSGIACWDMKYQYACWRPVTAVQLGDSDGNPNTVGDPAWLPLIVTPPFPSYTSGHSTFSGSAAVIMARFYGNDNIAFTSSSEGFVVPDRNFTSFSQASDEAARSRLYGGIHFRSDNEVGAVMGSNIGNFVYDNYLQAN